VIALRYVVDASVAEIAETLGLAEGTVKAQLHRGRQALAARLGAGTPEGAPMSEDRLRGAAEALHRSVAEVDVMDRLERLEGRRRRYRATSVAMAILLLAAVAGAVAVAAGRAGPPEPATTPTTTAPAVAPPGTVVATIPVQGGPSGVAVGDGAVWVATSGVERSRVVRINPASNRVVASVAVPLGQAELAVGAGAVWVASSSDNSVSRIDPATNKVAATIAVDRQPSGIAIAAGSVWVASALDDTVTRIDPARNRLIATIPIPGQGSALSLAAAGGSVWVSGNRGLSRLDPAGNRVTPVDACCGELAAGAGGLWVADGMNRAVLRVDPATGRVLARIPVPRAAAPEGPFRIAAAGGAVWVTAETVQPKPGDPSLLWRVDAAANRFAGTLRIGTVGRNHIAATLAAGRDTVWVAVGDRDVVLRIRP
jgi:YVTN family beta-propeller protein